MFDSNDAGPTLRHRIDALSSVVRARLNQIRLRRPGILHVLHARRGGTDKYVRELIAGTRSDYRHYLLVTTDDRWRVFDTNGATPATFEFRSRRASAGDDWLGSLCAWLSVGLVHVHSLVDTGELISMLEHTGVPYCYTVWDMYLPCPTVLLINDSGVYCNATTDPATCTRCLAGIGGLQHVDIMRWRRRSAAFLARAERIFAPSQWAKDTLAKYYPATRIEVLPPRPVHEHPDAIHVHRSTPLNLPQDAHRHIGVLGAVGPEKGARHVEALAQRIRERRLPLRIVVVGYMDRVKRDQSADRVLTVHGHYDESEVASLLDHYRVSLLIFPTVWPETFSFTLSEGWHAGRAALVPAVGALAERVAASGAGWIMRGFPDADAMLDQLLELTAPEHALELQRRSDLGKRTAAREVLAVEPMRSRYPEMLAGPTAARARRLTLSQMFRAGLQSAAIERSEWSSAG